MDIWKNFDSYEEKIIGETKKENAEEVALLMKAFAHFGLGFTLLPPLDGTELIIVRFGLLADNLNNLKVAIDAALKGYYRQSANFLRVIYENWLAFWYLIQFPGDAHFWLDPSWDKRPPKAETMRKKMEHPSQDSSEKAKELVIEYHRFAHTDPIAILTHMGEDGLRIGPTFDAGNFEASVYALILWIGMNLDAIESYISDDEWKQTHNGIKDEIEGYLENFNKKYGEEESGDIGKNA